MGSIYLVTDILVVCIAYYLGITKGHGIIGILLGCMTGFLSRAFILHPFWYFCILDYRKEIPALNRAMR